MNVLTFLLISLVVHLLPIPYREGMLRPRMLIKWVPFRLLWGALAWVVICLLSATTLPWAIISLVMSFGILMIINTGPRPGNFDNIIEGMRVPITCIGIIIIIVIPVFSGIITWTSDVSNAEYFDDMVEKTDEDLFESPIPDEMVRLVTQEYATYVAYQHIQAFGSNMMVASAHITTKQDRLVWVCTIVSQNVLAENFVKGFIVIDANDPQTVEPVIIENTTIPVGEGLFWDRNIQFGNYLNDMTAAYQYAYPTWDPLGNLVYVQTRTPLGFDYVERAIGPIVYSENGSISTYDSIEETPDWITQAYAEEWLERQVTRWGAYRRGDSFDLFAGGFLWVVPYSEDRLEMTEDTRYIVNPDSAQVEAFIAVHPVSSSRALAGIFRATKDKVYYHDMSGKGLVSGEAAAKNVEGQLTEPSQGFYYGAMPLLYPVDMGDGNTVWTWYTPIYWADGYYDEDTGDFYFQDMRLHALALVNASNIDRFYIQELGGTLTGGNLVRAAREGYITQFGGIVPDEPTDRFNLTATITNVTQYVEDGDTHIVLGTDNSSYWYIEGARAWMELDEWYTLLNLDTGDSFTATLQMVEGQNRIISIAKN